MVKVADIVLHLLYIFGESISTVGYPLNGAKGEGKKCGGAFSAKMASSSCCTPGQPGDGMCGEGEGDCDSDAHCLPGLKCGENNCPVENIMPKDFDCCYIPIGVYLSAPNPGPTPAAAPTSTPAPIVAPAPAPIVAPAPAPIVAPAPTEAPCTGTSFDWSCCSYLSVCQEKQGDCEDDYECAGSLVCGSNNCINFHPQAHPEANCCIKDDGGNQLNHADYANTDDIPGKQCGGYFSAKMASSNCCNPGQPGDGKCGPGEGDCDSDAHCLPGLKCGENNCPAENIMPKDFDCCYRPILGSNISAPAEAPIAVPIPTTVPTFTPIHNLLSGDYEASAPNPRHNHAAAPVSTHARITAPTPAEVTTPGPTTKPTPTTTPAPITIPVPDDDGNQLYNAYYANSDDIPDDGGNEFYNSDYANSDDMPDDGVNQLNDADYANYDDIPGKKCRGAFSAKMASSSCCNPGQPGDGKCGEGEGDCDSDAHCLPGLKCGEHNCPAENVMPKLFDCCYRPILDYDASAPNPGPNIVASSASKPAQMDTSASAEDYDTSAAYPEDNLVPTPASTPAQIAVPVPAEDYDASAAYPGANLSATRTSRPGQKAASAPAKDYDASAPNTGSTPAAAPASTPVQIAAPTPAPAEDYEASAPNPGSNHVAASMSTPDRVAAPALAHAEVWEKHEGKKCSRGNGAFHISLDECKEACRIASNCNGILRKTGDLESNGICYLQMDIKLEECETSTKYTLLLKPKDDGGNQLNNADYANSSDIPDDGGNQLNNGDYANSDDIPGQPLAKHHSDYDASAPNIGSTPGITLAPALGPTLIPAQRSSPAPAEDCKTMYGGVCDFPFTFNGRQYNGCTTDRGFMHLWCSTKSTFDWCLDGCPVKNYDTNILT